MIPRGQERASAVARVASHLKERLREPMAAPEASGPCAMIQDGRPRAQPDQRRRQQNHRISGSQGEENQTGQRHAHPKNERKRLGMFVRVEANDGLQNGPDDLKSQGDETDLSEVDLKDSFSNG
jgi:hypothetical protein